MNTRIHVAVGVIYNSDKNKVLITKRTAKQHLAGLWEFPGGKVEDNEDVMSALRRELYEELGITVEEAKQLTTVSYNYPDKQVLLDVWEVNAWRGDVESKENQEIVWSLVNELNNYNFPDANKHIIQTLSLGQFYVISQPTYQDSSRFLSVVNDCYTAGLKLFQLRLEYRNEPDFSMLIKQISELSKRHNGKLILNGTPEDVNTYEIDGIHLNSKELKKHISRPISENYILGASCHNEEELILAEKLNVNYAFVSPILKTTSHPDKEEIGWEKFHTLKKKVKFPVYALGGLNPTDLEVAKLYDAFGIAMISAIWNSTESVSQLLSS